MSRTTESHLNNEVASCGWRSLAPAGPHRFLRPSGGRLRGQLTSCRPHSYQTSVGMRRGAPLGIEHDVRVMRWSATRPDRG